MSSHAENHRECTTFKWSNSSNTGSDNCAVFPNLHKKQYLHRQHYSTDLANTEILGVCVCVHILFIWYPHDWRIQTQGEKSRLYHPHRFLVQFIWYTQRPCRLNPINSSPTCSRYLYDAQKLFLLIDCFSLFSVKYCLLVLLSLGLFPHLFIVFILYYRTRFHTCSHT